eukprot:349894-Chlamydomonas_euryale.AAC.5
MQFYGAVIGKDERAIVMQYVPRGSLHHLLHKETRLLDQPPPRVLVRMAHKQFNNPCVNIHRAIVLLSAACGYFAKAAPFDGEADCCWDGLPACAVPLHHSRRPEKSQPAGGPGLEHQGAVAGVHMPVQEHELQPREGSPPQHGLAVHV